MKIVLINFYYIYSEITGGGGKALEQYHIRERVVSTLENSQLGKNLIQVGKLRTKRVFWPCSDIMELEVDVAVIEIQILNFNVL